jgi:hypothetical protein
MQLKNQNPLDPLDTNQFTQQLVQFAQVEPQRKQNDRRVSERRRTLVCRLRPRSSRG